MGLKPDYKLLANGADVTATIRKHFVSLSFTDEAGMDSDQLEIVLSDDGPAAPIQIPDTGAELELFLGYDGAATRIGMFVVDQVECSGWPGVMTIKAHAAPFEGTKAGKTNLQTQKTRSWAKGTTLGAIVEKIAGEHGMAPAVATSLASIALPHTDQSDESDMHFLVRIARKYDAVVKPGGGSLVLAKRGETKTVTGKQMPTVTLAPGDVSDFTWRIEKRNVAGMVVAYYHATKNSKRIETKVGAGEPVTRLRMYYPTQAMAQAAAQAELDKRKRGEAKVSLNLEGRPELAAEAPLKLSGFRPGVDGDWIITRVEHALNDSGYTCSVDAETPNAGGKTDVTVSEN